MKRFFERHHATLDVDDIHRFAQILIQDLEAALPGYEMVVRLLDSPDRESELNPRLLKAISENRILIEKHPTRLNLPIVHEKRPLALIVADPPSHGGPAMDELALLPLLVRLSLEKILLYKINITDRETGLNNEYYFRTFLQRSLEDPQRFGPRTGPLRPLRLGEREELPGLTVMLAELLDFDRMAANHGRLSAVELLKKLASRLRNEIPGSMCLARLDRGRLGLILQREESELCAEKAAVISSRPELDSTGELPRIRLAFGLAGYPTDFTEDRRRPDEPSSMPEDPSGLFLAKAELALHQAMTGKDDNVLIFRDVLKRGGQIVQVLPYDRVVVNLGRAVGAREGLVFLLSDPENSDPAKYKGEVALFEVHQDYALGEVVNLKSSLSQVQAGDRLFLSRRSPREHPSPDPEAQDNIDPLLGIPDHYGFKRQLSGMLKNRDRFAVLLIQVDGYDQYRTTMGHLESDRHFQSLYELIRDQVVPGSLIGRFSAESLAVYLPDVSPEEALSLAESWRNQVAGRLRRTGSFGVAMYPCGPFLPEDIPANAQKALEHATFLGPSSLAMFDSVSLNISGDKRFETGDHSGAIEEYKKALQLNPRDLNVLNSLGVCYGYRQNLPEALTTFDQALAIDPENLMAHYNKGFALFMNGNPSEALDCFQRASEIAPDNFDVLFQLGKTALELDLIDDAAESFRAAADLKNRRAIVFRYLGQTLIKAGRTLEAVEAFKAAARHDPEDAPSLSQLGALFLDAKTDLDVALSLTRQAVDLDQTNSVFRQRFARALAVTEHLAEAEAEFNRVLEMGARSREIYFELGRVLERQGRNQEAIDLYRQSLEIDPEFKPASQALAELE